MTTWADTPSPLPPGGGRGPWVPNPARRRRTRLRVGIAALIVIVLVAVAAVVAWNSPALDQRLLESRYTAPISWSDCGQGYRCGAVQAPLDWGNPASGAIHLALIEHRATDIRDGAILVNPGGPGGSGVDLVGSDVGNAVTSAVAAHYDVIGFDPRGVGYSSAVRCGGSSELDRYLYGVLPGTIGSTPWLHAAERSAAQFADDCATDTGALLRHVDTASAARDMDLIRADLGEARLNYLGYSYGTQLGSVYAGLFPDHVGRFVLDGAIDIWSTSSSDSVVGQAAGFEGDLRAWMKACLAGAPSAVSSGSCPFSGSVDHGMATIRSLLARVHAHPLRNHDGRELSDATLALAMVDPLYSTSSWPDLTAMFRATLGGDPSKAFALADDYNSRGPGGKYYDNSTEAFSAIGCLDNGGVTSLADMRAEARRLRKAAPTLGKYEAYGELTCNAWKAPPVAMPAPPTGHGMNPLLVVGTTGDPATPYRDATALAKLMPTARLLTRVGEGHTAYDHGDTCVNADVDAYLLDGTLPATGTRCH